LRPVLPNPIGLVKIVYFVVSLPFFLFLVDPAHVGEEWFLVRVIYYVLLVSVYVLAFLACSCARDLRRMTVVVTACFFMSATYFHASLLLEALLVSTLALCLAFYSLRPLADARGEARANTDLPSNSSMGLGLPLRFASSHLVIALLLGGLIFCLFPRHWFRAPRDLSRMRGGDQVSGSLASAQQLAVAGASSRRDLLQLAHLVDFSRSSAEVLRLRMTSEPGGLPFYAADSMYLRGSLFETYSNGTWLSHAPAVMYRDDEDGRRDGWTWVRHASGRPNSVRVHQRFRMEPLEDVCFAVPEPLAINRAKIRFDERGVLIFSYKPLFTVEYEVISELARPADDPELQQAPSQSIPRGLATYLQIPTELRPVLDRLKMRWGPSRSPARQAQQICRFLQTHFGYGPASFVPGEGTDPLRNFLTDSGYGYCTHFASAMALLARAIGLPARVATGFHFAGLPEADGYYHIRDLNAHAWTEIYFPQYGWIIFDATPPANRPTLEKTADPSSFWGALLKLGHLQDLVSEFSSSEQKDLVGNLEHLGRITLSWWKHSLASARLWLGLVLGVALIWALFHYLPLRVRRRISQGLAGARNASSVPFYDDFLWILRRHGFAKPASLTGQEYTESLLRQLPYAEIVHLNEQFYGVKYGGRALSEEELLQISHQLRRLERLVGKRKIDLRPDDRGSKLP
jgi:transglutaminase-like putative cysteine protease